MITSLTETVEFDDMAAFKMKRESHNKILLVTPWTENMMS